MKPSPSLFPSKPPLALTCSRMTALCSRRTSMKRESPRRSAIAVEPSMSLNMMVTVPSGAACDFRSGCSASASLATVSIEEPMSLRSTPCAFSLSASARSSNAFIQPLCDVQRLREHRESLLAVSGRVPPQEHVRVVVVRPTQPRGRKPPVHFSGVVEMSFRLVPPPKHRGEEAEIAGCRSIEIGHCADNDVAVRIREKQVKELSRPRAIIKVPRDFSHEGHCDRPVPVSKYRSRFRATFVFFARLVQASNLAVEVDEPNPPGWEQRELVDVAPCRRFHLSQASLLATQHESLGAEHSESGK